MSNLQEIESVLFKRVSDGYVFQAPNPWVFGPSSRYLVNEAQKAALLAVIAARRPVLVGVVIMIGLFLLAVAAGTLVWAVSGHGEPTGLDLLAIIVLILASLYAALVWALRRNRRRTQPILAGLPRTEARITQSEQRHAMANAMSFRRSLLLGATWTITSLLACGTLVIRNNQYPLFGDAMSFMTCFNASIAAWLAVHYLVIAIRKFRQKEDR